MKPGQKTGAGDWAPEMSHQVNRGASVTVNRREVAGHVARSGEARGHTGPKSGQAKGQMEPLYLAMMRALWIWRTHEMRLMASCNQVARAC